MRQAPDALGDALHIAGPLCDASGRPRLTVAQESILEMLALGLRTKEIATVTYRSRADVEYHVANLIRLFAAQNRAGTVARAFVLGMLATGWPPRVVVPVGEGPVSPGPRVSARRRHRR